MKIRPFLSFLLLLTIQNLIFSQQDFKQGYIITLENDTLQGFIDYRGDAYNSQKCRYRADMNSEVTSFSPERIKAYRFTDGKYYVAKEVEIPHDAPEKPETKYVFLEYLMEGKADVYYLFYEGKKIYYIEKDETLLALYEAERIIKQEGGTYISKDQTYKGLLAYSFKETPELRDKINQMRLNQKNLIKLSSEYHNKVCPGEECIIYKKKNTSFVVAPGALVVYNINRMKILILEKEHHDIIVSSAIGGGIDCDFWNKGSMERFFFNFKIQFFNNDHSAYFDRVYFYQPYATYVYGPYEGTFNTKNFYIACVFSYIYPKYKIKPYIGGGVSFYKTYQSDSELTWNYVNYTSLYDADKTVYSPLISAGVKLEFNKYLYFKLESVFNMQTQDKTTDEFSVSKTSNLNTSFSLHYVISKKE